MKAVGAAGDGGSEIFRNDPDEESEASENETEEDGETDARN